jgi:two-component system, cell cycle sensor histidine kinase and response regulator CckA
VTPPIRVLHLEDNPRDAELVHLKLEVEGVACDFVVTNSRNSFEAALAGDNFDLIISDYDLPGYDGITALKRAQETQPDTPVIIISGSLGEEEAVKCLQVGATDYLLKERLDRLVPAVQRAIQEAEVRRKRKQAEQAVLQRERALRESEDRTNFALAAAGMGVWEIDFATNRLTWSDTLAPVFGLTPDRAPKTTEEFFQLIHPDDRKEVERSVARAIAGESACTVEFRTLWPDGSTPWVYGHAQVSYDGDGRPLRLLGVGIDITARKSLEAQLQQAQKMEAIGQLAGGIAHDFNNLLTIINGTAELALAQASEGNQLHEDLQEIRRAGERAAALTHQLLAFSRKQILQPQVMNLDTVVAEMETMVRRLIGEDVDLVVVPTQGLGSVKADRGQVEQVIANLVVNARDAMPQGGKLTLETQNIEIDEHYARQHGVAVAPGSYVMLVISDNGVGIDESTSRRIFEPFFTTKGPGKGTGLGLSTVYGIVKQSNGFIWVYSEIGQGTSFKICLPHVAEVAGAELCSSTLVPVRGTETILLVEDVGGLRILTKRVLASAGYTVLTAANGEEAMLVLKQYKQPVQLMVTDVVMPGLSGRKLAELVDRTREGIKVLFMSGYTDDVVVRHGVLEEGMPFLSKPFTAEALTRKVRQVLDSKS